MAVTYEVDILRTISGLVIKWLDVEQFVIFMCSGSAVMLQQPQIQMAAVVECKPLDPSDNACTLQLSDSLVLSATS